MEFYINWWIFKAMLVCYVADYFRFYAICEYYSYDDDYILAFVNVTYKEPRTGRLRSEKGEIGKFSTGRVEPVSGIVVHVTSNNRTSHDGCEPLVTEGLPREPWIALVQHGNCRDSVKLSNIATMNASAAVIYGIQPGSRLIKLHHKVFQMVSVFIPKEKGEEIASLVDNGTQVLMQITIGSHNSFHYAINRTSVLFVSISFIILMIISLAWLVFYYIQRFRYIHAKDLLANRLCSAAKRALDKIPVKAVKSGDKEAEDMECCAVCIEPFKVGEIVRLLPCKHIFHKSCVDPWLLDQRSCPMCKMDILKFYGLVFSGSQESVLNFDDDIHHHHGDLQVIHVPIHRPLSPVPSHTSSDGETPVHTPTHHGIGNRNSESKLLSSHHHHQSLSSPKQIADLSVDPWVERQSINIPSPSSSWMDRNGNSSYSDGESPMKLSVTHS